jgi:predicted ATPase/class 3 adenylate cyclase
MPSVPSGTVTLLFTDIEGSTRLLRSLGAAFAEVLAVHHELLRGAIAERGGTELGSAGDGLYAAFPSARAAVLAAVEGQQRLAAQIWPGGVTVKVRMGLHTGEPAQGATGLVGIDVHRAARISAAGHGGQILVSRTARDLLGDELPPGYSLRDLGEHRLKDLPEPERIYQVQAPGLETDFPAVQSADARPNNLPRRLTTVVGRDAEIAEARRTLAVVPLLTLTGPGGVGKTRLAEEVASQALDDFEGGIWFVELGSIADPSLVEGQIAAVLGIVDQPGQPLLTTIVDHLRGRTLLLVLDDCEHVLAVCADIADAILRSCESIRIIATSREPLGIEGEALLSVPSLSAPDPEALLDPATLTDFAAARLFVERARAAQPSFAVSAANAASIARICRRLDGIPLAIELAAARVRALPPEQIAARLDDRFRLLTGGLRTAVPRHQTLRATMDWSFELLSERERAVLRRLAVFAGGATLEAAEAICGSEPVEAADVLDMLTRLVDRSLVMADASGEESRFRLLETVREYGRERLVAAGDAGPTLRAHRDWYLALVEEAAAGFFHGPPQATWIARLDREHDNLRAALAWSHDQPGERETGLRIAAAMWRYWEIRGHQAEGLAWLERMLDTPGAEPTALRANAFTGAGILAFMKGDATAAWRFHEQSLESHRSLGDQAAISYAASNLANVALQLDRPDQARALYEEGLTIAMERGDAVGAGISLLNLGDAWARIGDRTASEARFEEAVEAFRRLGDRWLVAQALDGWGLARGRAGDAADARELHEQALGIYEGIGDARSVARVLLNLGDLTARTGDLAEAEELLRRSLEVRVRIDDLPGIAVGLEHLAWVVAPERAESAATLLGTAEAIRDRLRAPVPLPERATYQRQRDALVEGLGRTAFDAARDAGRAMSLGAALARPLPVPR